MGASHSSWWCSTICSALVHHHDAWFLAAQFLCQNLVAQKDQLAKQKDAVVKMNAKRSLGLKTVDLTHEVFTQNSPISNNRPEMGWDIYRPEPFTAWARCGAAPRPSSPQGHGQIKKSKDEQKSKNDIYIYLYYKFTLYKYNIHMHVYIDMYICSSRLCYAHVRVVFSIKHAIWGGAKFDTSWQKNLSHISGPTTGGHTSDMSYVNVHLTAANQYLSSVY